MAIKKRSKVPGVMITQFVEEIPAGKSHPDFIRKPIALTIQEGEDQQRNQTIIDSNTQRIMSTVIFFFQESLPFSNPSSMEIRRRLSHGLETMGMYLTLRNMLCPIIKHQENISYRCFNMSNLHNSINTNDFHILFWHFERNPWNGFKWSLEYYNLIGS